MMEKTIEEKIREAICPGHRFCTSNEAAVRRIMEIVKAECAEARRLGYLSGAGPHTGGPF